MRTALLRIVRILALLPMPIWAAETTVTVDGKSMPWEPSLNPSFSYGIADGLGPTIIDLSAFSTSAGSFPLVIHSTGGTVSAAPSFFPYVDANGITNQPTNDSNGFTGMGFPSRYMVADWDTYLTQLVGTFTDSAGVIVGTPFELGTGFRTLSIPPGATNLQLGINDDVFADNDGFFDVTVFQAVDVAWQEIGSIANACDLQPQGCFGAVAHEYEISRYEITNAQYARFLNAVAATDANGLYSTDMGSVGDPAYGGIARDGDPGSYAYTAIIGYENVAVNHVTWFSALRYANWLHNGKPGGPQDNTTTEDGAYTFTGPDAVGPRNAAPGTFLPNEDEWYKAAYFDPVTPGYFAYPTSSNDPTTCSDPAPDPNSANCTHGSDSPKVVGSYPGSPSPSGTLDQGGNAFEWTETADGTDQITRGGSYLDDASALLASSRLNQPPSTAAATLGFRVVRQLPEPDRGVASAAGVLLLVALLRARRQIP